MGCAPTISELVAKVATPSAIVIGAPRFVVPSMNCTVPVAAKGTDVVNVTCCPWLEGLFEEAKETSIGAGSTVSGT
jgi:hypothetical protein